MKNKMQELYTLEQLSSGNTFIHKLDPRVKLVTTIIFIVAVVSFDRYAFGRLIPYIFYPALLMALSETPYKALLKRFLIALPFCLFAGITNVVFDREPAFTIGGILISCGMVSFFTILFRTYLCVMAVLVLMSVTPFSEIMSAMRQLRMPLIFAAMFEMTYRYINVLFEEAYSMYTAYSLRSAGAKGIKIQDMGSFAGQLLLRSFDRAERIFNAMKCRGYTLRRLPLNSRRLTRGDLIYFIVICFFCLVLRFINVNALLGGVLGGFA